MKKLITILIVLFALEAFGAVKTYYFVTPGGQPRVLMTGNAKHQALLDVWFVKKAKMEKPTRQSYTTEEWKAMTPEARQEAHALKIKRTKVTYFNKKLRKNIILGDDMEYTYLWQSPLDHLDDDPNDVTDLNEVK